MALFLTKFRLGGSELRGFLSEERSTRWTNQLLDRLHCTTKLAVRILWFMLGNHIFKVIRLQEDCIAFERKWELTVYLILFL
jgi:hypothetical protein